MNRVTKRVTKRRATGGHGGAAAKRPRRRAKIKTEPKPLTSSRAAAGGTAAAAVDDAQPVPAGRLLRTWAEPEPAELRETDPRAPDQRSQSSRAGSRTPRGAAAGAAAGAAGAVEPKPRPTRARAAAGAAGEPAGWSKEWDARGREYWWHASTGKSQWRRPSSGRAAQIKTEPVVQAEPAAAAAGAAREDPVDGLPGDWEARYTDVIGFALTKVSCRVTKPGRKNGISQEEHEQRLEELYRRCSNFPGAPRFRYLLLLANQKSRQAEAAERVRQAGGQAKFDQLDPRCPLAQEHAWLSCGASAAARDSTSWRYNLQQLALHRGAELAPLAAARADLRRISRPRAKGISETTRRGVYWRERDQKWEAKAWIGGKQVYVAKFEDEAKAAEAVTAVEAGTSTIEEVRAMVAAAKQADPKRKTSSSHRGVSWNKAERKWRACVSIGGG